jgi:peptide chain release factor 1
MLKVSERYQQREASAFKVEWFSGTGAGGQHRNKHQNSCRLIHIPTGLKREAQCRSRQNSYNEAMAGLLKALDEQARGESLSALAKDRREQVGSGMRGDKVRTYREQDGVVTDHASGKKAQLVAVCNGKLNLLWR